MTLRQIDTLVVLRVRVENNKEWWEAMGLPAPYRWEMAFGKDVAAEVECEHQCVNDLLGPEVSS